MTDTTDTTNAYDGAAGTDRVQQFKADVASMKVRDPATGRDRLLLRLGVLGMLVGIGIAVYAWTLSFSADGPLQQRDAIVQAVVGLTLAVVGAALFVKAALAGFLRFWLARLCYEQQAQTDRLLAGSGAAKNDQLPV